VGGWGGSLRKGGFLKIVVVKVEGKGVENGHSVSYPSAFLSVSGGGGGGVLTVGEKDEEEKRGPGNVEKVFICRGSISATRQAHLGSAHGVLRVAGTMDSCP